MDWHTIKCEEMKKGIFLVTLNRPESRNALSILMRREIIEALAAFREDEGVKALIFTGEGKTFCAGFDLKEFAKPELAKDLFESSARYHRDLWNFPKPTIAAVNGAAMGGGFDLATLCDIRICSASAMFGHPEIKFGGPPLFTPLRWIVGHGLARDLCLTGRKIPAVEAHRIGLVSEVVSEESLIERAIEIGQQILEAPSAALACTKEYLIGNTEKGFEESFVIEHDETFRRFLLKNE